jgi:hypothetical protein
MPVHIREVTETQEVIRVGRHPRHPVDVLLLGTNGSLDAWDAALRMVDVLVDTGGLPEGAAAVVADNLNAQVRPARELVRMEGMAAPS